MFGYSNESLTTLMAVTDSGTVTGAEFEVLNDQGLILLINGKLLLARTDTLLHLHDWQTHLEHLQRLGRDILAGASTPVAPMPTPTPTPTPPSPYRDCSELEFGTQVTAVEITEIPAPTELPVPVEARAELEPFDEPTHVPEPIAEPAPEVVPMAPEPEIEPAPEPEPEPLHDEAQWDRVIQDLPQAYEALRPYIRLLVKHKLADNLYLSIYKAAWLSKELAKTREFLTAFAALPDKLNESGNTINEWFEFWLRAIVKEVKTFDGSEAVQTAIREMLKLAPDDRKEDVLSKLQGLVATGDGKFFPAALSKFKELNSRVTIGTPIRWITTTAGNLRKESDMAVARPPKADPELVNEVMALMPPMNEGDTEFYRQMYTNRLNHGGVSMEAFAMAWHTKLGNPAEQPMLRLSAVLAFLKSEGLTWVSTSEALVPAAQRVIGALIAYYQRPEDDPYRTLIQEFWEANAFQVAWVSDCFGVLFGIPAFEDFLARITAKFPEIYAKYPVRTVAGVA